MRRVPYVVGVLCLAVLLTSCFPWQKPQPLSATGVATVALKTYHTQVKQTEEMSKRPDLTEAEKVMVRKKKAIIVRLDPKIKMYGNIIAIGSLPTDEQVAEINKLIDQLVAVAIE